MFSPTALSLAALERITETELKLLRGLDHERCLLFDAHGALLHQADGDRFRVGIASCRIQALRPAASSHNHLFELSHSSDDVIIAIRSDVLEARVVAPEHRYRLLRPVSGWPDVGRAEACLTRSWRAAWAMLVADDPVAARMVRRRIVAQATGCYTDLTHVRELAAWATSYLESLAVFSSTFAAPVLIEPLP